MIQCKQRIEVGANLVLTACYQKKRSEGKHNYTAIGAVARKLTFIIYAVLCDNKPYVPNCSIVAFSLCPCYI